MSTNYGCSVYYLLEVSLNISRYVHDLYINNYCSFHYLLEDNLNLPRYVHDLSTIYDCGVHYSLAVKTLKNKTPRSATITKKKVREKFRECHNHIPQPFPDPKRKREPTNLNKHKPNKRTKSTKISSLFPKRRNRNTKRTEKHKNKMTKNKSQPVPDTKRRRKETQTNTRKTNKCLKSIQTSSLFLKRGNRNAEMIEIKVKKNCLWKQNTMTRYKAI